MCCCLKEALKHLSSTCFVYEAPSRVALQMAHGHGRLDHPNDRRCVCEHALAVILSVQNHKMAAFLFRDATDGILTQLQRLNLAIGTLYARNNASPAALHVQDSDDLSCAQWPSAPAKNRADAAFRCVHEPVHDQGIRESTLGHG